MLLEGIFLPLTTPFHPDGRLFLRKLESNVERYSRTPASGMFVLGREGEGDALTDAETREALKAAIGAAADEKVMIASAKRKSVAAAMEFVNAAAELGYDAVALRPSFGFAHSETRLFFEMVADRSPVPILIEGTSAGSWSCDLVTELAEHPQIGGALYVESSLEGLKQLLQDTATVSREVTVTNVFSAVTGRMLRQREAAENFVPAANLGGIGTAVMPVAPALKTRTKRVGFQVLAGSTSNMLDAWILGSVGGVPRLAACAPQACCEVWQAFKDGDPALAAEKQERVRAAAQLVEGQDTSGGGIAALKYSCDLNAYFGGMPRLPLLALTAEGRAAMETALAGIKN
jgi:4-hydroxy-2-oxoglutarate aldolase